MEKSTSSENSGEHIHDAVEPVAIIGMSCRFPGEGSTVSGFWDMISNGRSAHSEIPKERFNAEAYYHPSNSRRGGINTKHGFFLKEDVALFDAPFFAMTVQEADGMDPMHKLTLEVVYEAFENAGIPMENLPGSKTSVFHGCFTGDYSQLSGADVYDTPPYQATGNGLTMMSNRVSWFFDLRGPSMTVDTACSSTLSALHLACQSLRLGESTIAIVSGSNLILGPDMMHSLTALSFLSPDGISHSFDVRANGYARGEAIGALILKPLNAAIKDGDTIRAVIRGTGSNQDGRTTTITQPSSEAQADLIRSTYARIGVSLDETGYFEAHGTGTAVGDPIELSALGATFGMSRSANHPPLYVASVKSNIGHTEGCSGLAGVLKAVLCLERGLIPPNSGLENVNPALDLKGGRIEFPQTLTEWPNTGVRRASINSFGYGGANAHAILDDAYSFLKLRGLDGHHFTLHDATGSEIDSGVVIPTTSTESEEEYSENHLFVFSTKDQEGLQRIAESYANFIEDKIGGVTQFGNLEDVQWKEYKKNLAYTLSRKRSLFKHRSFAVAPSLRRLSEILKKDLFKSKTVDKQKNMVWVFTGQGAQWSTMGKELISNNIFRASMLKSQHYIQNLGCPWSIIKELSNPNNLNIDSPELCQPLCTALQVALVDLLTYWGLSPVAVVGHSSGEIGAAYAASAISHDDAIKIAYYRGIFSANVLSQGTKEMNGLGGAMSAVGLGETEMQPYLEKVRKGSAVVACINSPSSVTISGDIDSITQLESMLTSERIFAKRLRIPTAYHSHHMNSVANEYLQSLGSIEPLVSHRESIKMFSSVTGELVPFEALKAHYWVSNFISPVRFLQTCQGLFQGSTFTNGRSAKILSHIAIVEVGPHEALKGPVNQILTSIDAELLRRTSYASLLLRGQRADETALSAAGKLWCEGYPVDLLKVNGEGGGKNLTDLPPYPWNHAKAFWHEPYCSKLKRFQKYPRTDLLGMPIHQQNPYEPRWRNFLSIQENPWLQQHKIQGSVLFPGAGMLIMAIEAALQIADAQSEVKALQLRDVKFYQGLVIPSAGDSVETALNIRPHKNGTEQSGYHFTVYSCSSDGIWTEHSSGLISIIYETKTDEVDNGLELRTEWKELSIKYKEICDKAMTAINHQDFYENLEAIGMQYGPLFANLIEAYASPGSSIARGSVIIPDTKSVMPQNFEYPHVIHPATLDAIFHILFVAFTEGDSLPEAIVPVGLESMYISMDLPQGAGKRFNGFAITTVKGERESAGRLVFSDEDWLEPRLIIDGFAARAVSSSATSANVYNQRLNDKLCGQLLWKADVDHLKGEMLADLMMAGNRTNLEIQLSNWLELFCHKEADLNVVIIEGPTSRKLDRIVQLFGPTKGKRFCFRQCTVIKKSVEEVEEARNETDKGDLVVSYKTHDFFSDQGKPRSPDGLFDLVIADMQHSTDSEIESRFNTLTGVLKDSGRLILTGLGSSDHEKLKHNCRLEVAGYTGVETFLETPGLPGHANDSLLMTSLAIPTKSLTDIQDIVILEYSDMSPNVSVLKDNLCKHLTIAGYGVQTTTVKDIGRFKNANVISLLEVEVPWIIHWTASDFADFHKMIKSVASMLWLTRGGQMMNSEAVEFAPTTGLLRTLRTEMPQIKLPHLDLSPNIDLTQLRTTKLILSTFYPVLVNPTSNSDMEFAEKDFIINVPRLVEDKSFDRELRSGPVSLVTNIEALHQVDRPLRLAIGIPGHLDKFYWANDDEAFGQIAPDEVEIEIRMIGLNLIDLDAAMGHSQDTTFGYEVAGIITARGTEVNRLRVGQTVLTIRSDSAKTAIRQHQDFVHEVPKSFTLAEVTGSMIVGLTSFYALFELAHISKGESVLIHNASGGIGQIAIQIAQQYEAKVYVTVGSNAKKSLLIERYGLHADHIFSSLDLSFAKGLMRMTGGKGVDIALSDFTGEYLRQTWLCMADFGRFVNLSRKADELELPRGPFDRNVVFHNLNLEHVIQKRPTKICQAIDNIMHMIEDGGLRNPFPVSTYSAPDIEQAFKLMQSGACSGKVLLDISGPQRVSIEPRAARPLCLDPKAAYVLSGGLGGIGPKLAETMFGAGARRLVFLSRSGASSPSSQHLLESLRQRGCEVEAIVCDVSDYAAVEAALGACENQGWRIKGAVQCAMVLKDSPFANMTFEKWKQATQPKIQGSWNLHKLLPKDMDFFILLSSVVGIIGNAAQANYIAGNTFMDALAHLRRSQGLAGTSIDVGVVSDSGHFTDDAEFRDFLQHFPHLASLQMTTPDLNLVLATVMKGKTTDGLPVPAQLVTGVRDELQREGNITSLWAHDRKFNHRLADATKAAAKTKQEQLVDDLRSAKTLVEAGAAIEQALKDNLAASVHITPADVDGERSLASYGMDSLKAIEIRNWVFREIKADISIFDILSKIPLTKLSVKIASKSALVSEEVVRQLDEDDPDGLQEQ